MERFVSLVGLFVMLLLAWLISSHRRRVPWRIVVGGLFLQFAFALLILKTAQGQWVFDQLDVVFRTLLGFVDAGSEFIFGISPRPDEESLLPPRFTLLRTFAFGVLPTIIFFSSLMAVLYYLGVMQQLVKLFAWIMRKTLGTSGAETLAAAANVFVGQAEAPLVVRPYIAGMTMSELNSLMVGGFATIAGGVLAAYVGMGISAGHLITASVISAPAALMIAKVLLPETESPQTLRGTSPGEMKSYVNVIEAAADGATDGLKLALNVGAVLLAFIALIALLDAVVGWTGSQFGYVQPDGSYVWSLRAGLAYLFAPLARVMGIPWQDCMTAGELLGIKMVVNEFVAFDQLGGIVRTIEANQHAAIATAAAMPWSTQATLTQSSELAMTSLQLVVLRDSAISQRSITILTYALCGFANFSSIGIQLGGIGGIAPTRTRDLAKLGLRAMIGGTLAAFMTACVVGILLPT